MKIPEDLPKYPRSAFGLDHRENENYISYEAASQRIAKLVEQLEVKELEKQNKQQCVDDLKINLAKLESELAQARAEIERLKLQSEHADCWWDDDNRVGCPEEYADEEALKVGEEFELLAAAYWPTKYRVTAVRDHETDEGEYTCELLKGRREEFETYFQIKSERDSLRAQLEQMGRPVTTGECSRFRDNYGDSTLSLYWIDRALTAILAARARRQEKP